MPTIEVNGARVAYSAAGAGETVLLLHSSGASGAQWRTLVQDLQTRYRVLAPDLHGYGQTEPQAGSSAPGLADAAALVDAVLAREVRGSERVHLIGHSYGGAVALRWAADRPAQLLSLTLIEPVSFHLLSGAPANSVEQLLLSEIAALAADVRELAASGDSRLGMARFIDYWNGAGSWARLRPDLQAALARQAGQVALDFRATMADPLRAEALRRIDVPTLMLRGGASPQPTQQIAALATRFLPDARLRTIGAAGHMLPLTHGEAVNAAIAEHLARNTAIQRRAAAA